MIFTTSSAHGMLFTVLKFTEETALCTALSSIDCDPRGDNECVRSRRQVVKKLPNLLSLLYFHFILPFILFIIIYYSCYAGSFAGALMAGILQGKDTDSCVRMGLLAARMSLASPHPISPILTLDSVDPNKTHAPNWPTPGFLWVD